jgi:hypothetical protein
MDSVPNIDDIRLCDAGCRTGGGAHVVLITGIERDRNGKIQYVTITHSSVRVKGERMTFDAFKDMGYPMYRNKNLWKTGYLPTPYSPIAGEPVEEIVYSDLCTDRGDCVTIRTDETITINPLVTEGYSEIKLYKDGEEINTYSVGDSVAHILEEMGLESCGAPGTTAALALLNDAVKKGGVMASSSVGGLSGAFIPVSEDLGMIDAAEKGALSLEKLEAMTAVCSVGLDMIAIPGDTTADAISGIIADEMAIGMVNNKTTAVRVIPVPGKGVGDFVEFGGLLGKAPIMAVNKFSQKDFIARGGRIPAPLHSLKN